jgi:prepilin peptidase CpaA
MIVTVLLLVLAVSLYTDVKRRKILNSVTIPSIVFGFLYYLFSQGVDGFFFSGKGFLAGFSFLFIPYLLGGMGAGDVKLMAAIGALMGTNFVFYSFIYTALIGGVISIVLILKKNGVKYSFKSFFFHLVFFRSNLGSLIAANDKKSSILFPYGVAISLGTCCALLWRGF